MHTRHLREQQSEQSVISVTIPSTTTPSTFQIEHRQTRTGQWQSSRRQWLDTTAISNSSFSFTGYGLCHISQRLQNQNTPRTGSLAWDRKFSNFHIRRLGQSFRSKTASVQAIHFLHILFLTTVSTHTHNIFRHL